MSVPLVLDELGSDLSRSVESRQKEAHGEFGETCNVEDKEEKRVARRMKTYGSRPAMAEVIGSRLLPRSVVSGIKASFETPEKMEKIWRVRANKSVPDT